MSINILGISAFYHDSAACLLQDGIIAAGAHEERFTRKKHDASFPMHAIAYCLEEGCVKAADLDHIVFYDKPWIKFERLLETYVTFAPRGFRAFLMAMPEWLRKKLWIEDQIHNNLNTKVPVLFPEHHQSHAASAFFPSPYESAAIITMDGVGEWSTATWGLGNQNHIDLEFELKFPHSLGLLYSAFTYYTGFRVNSGEYKLMGLAPYGEPKYVKTIRDNLIDLKEDGSFRLNMRYFDYCSGLTMTNRRFNGLFGGPPRTPESELTQKQMDLARSIQAVTEEVVFRTAKHVRKETESPFLCLAGGVALNCVANGKIHRAGIFKDIWIQPAAGDAGGALGAAYFAWHQILNRPRTINPSQDQQQGSQLGPSFHTEKVATWANTNGFPFKKMPEDQLIGHIAEAISRQKIVGWFQGRMEFGPRALGNRSILGDPRNQKTQTDMNLKIKFRESFRPFAPSCLLEDAPHIFDLDDPSPYMLLVASVRNEHRKPQEKNGLWGLDLLNLPRSRFPAITHVDFSARVQTVEARTNPRYARLLRAFKDISGFGILVNTSFNVRGEPIVCTPEHAYSCFRRTEMDILVIEDLVFYKTQQPSWEGKGTEGKPWALD